MIYNYLIILACFPYIFKSIGLTAVAAAASASDLHTCLIETCK